MNRAAHAAYDVVRRSVDGWVDDNGSSMGAALAFYSLLSLAPLLALVIAAAGVFVGADRAQELLMSQMSGLLGATGAQGVKTMLDAAATPKGGIVASVVSFAVLVASATTVFAELQSDLNRIWDCRAPRSSGAWRWLRQRLLSFGMILAVGFLLLVSLVVSAAISFLGGAGIGGSEALGHGLEFVASVLATTLLFALTFKILPSRPIPWGDVWIGSLITALLFWIGKFAIGLYIGRSSVASSFGAAGTVVVVILWVYYSAQIFFFGAEITRTYSMVRGSRSGAEAANVEYEPDPMIARARRIVEGRDPVVRERRSRES